jgi:hypothetical protein
MSMLTLFALSWAIPALLLTGWTGYVYRQLTRTATGSFVSGLTPLHPLCHGCLTRVGDASLWVLAGRPGQDATKAVFAVALIPGINATMLLMAACGIVWFTGHLWLQERRNKLAPRQVIKPLQSRIAS